MNTGAAIETRNALFNLNYSKVLIYVNYCAVIIDLVVAIGIELGVTELWIGQ